MYEKNKDENYNNLKGINEKVSDYLTTEGEFLDLRNYAFERPGALVSRPGTFDFASLPLASYAVASAGLFEYIKSSGFSLLISDIGDKLYSGYNVQVGQSLTPNATTSYNIDFNINNDFLFFSNGYTYQRFDGSFSVRYGVPKQRSFIIGAGVSFNVSLAPSGATTVVAAGDYIFRYSPVKYGPTLTPTIGQRVQDDETGVDLEFIVTLGATVVSKGNWVLYGFTIQPGYGVSSVLPWKIQPGASFYNPAPTLFPFSLQAHSGFTLYTVAFPHYLDTFSQSEQFWFTLIPKYLETYNNMMFMAGFSSAPSTVWYSNLAEPDQVDAENFFDVRTSNGDVITNMIVFQTNMVIFKYGSTHELTGSSPDTLSLKDVNLSYGCVNNTAAVTFRNKLWFMDIRGICEYNGPNTFVVSYRVETALNSVDKNTCRAFYVKKRNEVWFFCSGKGFVYDVDMDAWTIFDNLQIESARGANILNFGATVQDLAYVEKGASFVQFTRFSDTTFTDRGVAITLIGKTRFHKRSDSTQEMWRRFYLNNDIVAATNVTINLYSDYSSGASNTISTDLSQFQSRKEIGVSARALSIEWIIKSTTQVVINGYTVESRYLRDV